MPAPVTASTDLDLVELFSSVQGEGVWIGCRQVFLRLAGCNLGCRYCDTDFASGPTCRIETVPGSGRFEIHPNPVDPGGLVERLERWRAEGLVHHSINLTGGEPLLQAEALAECLPRLRACAPIHLETNGVLADRLSLVLPFLDFVSMDLKLASTSGEETPWQEHRRFLETVGRLDCQVKCIVGMETGTDELAEASKLLRDLHLTAPLVLQPVTVAGLPSVPGKRLLDLQEAALRHYDNVRVIPQIHPLLKVL